MISAKYALLWLHVHSEGMRFSSTSPRLSPSLSRVKTRCSTVLLWFPKPKQVFHQLHLQSALSKGVQQLHGICSVNGGFARIRRYKTQHPSLTNKDFCSNCMGRKRLSFDPELCVASRLFTFLCTSFIRTLLLSWKDLFLSLTLFVFCRLH